MDNNQQLNQEKTNHKNKLTIALVILFTISLLANAYFATSMYANTSTKQPDVQLSTNSAKQTEDKKTGFTPEQALDEIKLLLDEKDYADVDNIEASAESYILEEDDYNTQVTALGYTINYRDTEHRVKDGYSSKKKVQDAFPSMSSIYNDVESLLLENGFTIDKGNTYTNLEKSGPSGGQQVAATNDQTVCVVTPLHVTAYGAGTTATPDEYRIGIACSSLGRYAAERDIQIKLVDAFIKEKTSTKKLAVVVPNTQVGDFTSAGTFHKNSDVGGNRLIFMKKGNSWEYITSAGQSVPSCTLVDGIKIPISILDSCFDSSNNVRKPIQ